MMPEVYLVNGSGPGKLAVGAHLAPGREVSIWTYIEASGLPASVQTALQAGLQGKEAVWVLAVGPALGTVVHYEIDFAQDMERHTLAISADGQKTWFIDPVERRR
jgi:hypothetical protein